MAHKTKDPPTINIKIVEAFEKLIDQIKFDIDHATSRKQSLTDHYRLRQITKSLDQIRKYPKEITSGSELASIPGVGKGTISRIDEIIKTGKLSEIKLLKEQEQYLKDIENLEKVFGIGRKTASDLVKVHNIHTPEELRDAYNNGSIQLSDTVLKGLKYFDVVQRKIPRAEIDQIYLFVGYLAMEIDPELFTVICGSYRRLRPTSNDIDILVTHPKLKTRLMLETSNKNYLRLLVNSLKRHKFIIEDLTDKDYTTNYRGFCKFKDNPVRRIDMKYVPHESYYTALVHFTGSDTFNVKIRTLAIQLGYKLSENGLYKIEGKKEIRIKIESEKQIFDILGLEYVAPEDRN